MGRLPLHQALVELKGMEEEQDEHNFVGVILRGDEQLKFITYVSKH